MHWVNMVFIYVGSKIYESYKLFSIKTNAVVQLLHSEITPEK